MLLVSVLSVTVCWQVVSTPRADKTFSLPLVGKKKFSSAKCGEESAKGYSGKGRRHKKSNPGGLLVFYQRSSSETESFLRAWRRRALRTRRPLALAILARKPCLFTRLRREGWNVLFMICLFYIFRVRTAKVVIPEEYAKFFWRFLDFARNDKERSSK